jgi:4-hydroxybenzoate polyprenyltransferase
MSGSMIINDIFDINIDKINNPNRPLVKNTINLYEAIIATILIYGLSFYLNNKYIYGRAKQIGNLSIVLSLLYTPIFKKILLIKNIICAIIVSNTILYSGLLFETDSNILLYNFFKIIFASSMYIEILQDIKDYEGDLKNKIYTIPVILGKNISYKIILSILFSAIINILVDNRINNRINKNLLILIPFFPMIINLINVKLNNYSNLSIKYALNSTTYSLLMLFITILYIIK